MLHILPPEILLIIAGLVPRKARVRRVCRALRLAADCSTHYVDVDLKSCPHLTDVVTTIKRLPHLQRLSVSLTDLDNNATAALDALPCLLDAAPASCIETISVTISPSVAHHSSVDTAAMASALSKMSSLHTMHLSGINLGALPTTLSKMPGLRCLTICSNALKIQDTEALGLALSAMTALKSLDLSNNYIGADGAAALAPGLSAMPALKSLSLEENYLGAQGAAALAPALSAMTAMQSLDLRDNHFRAWGAAELVPAIRRMKKLHTIKMTRNKLDEQELAIFLQSAGIDPRTCLVT